MALPANRDAIDIGSAIKFPFGDTNWIKSGLLLAVCMFIPLLGPFVVLGWQRATYEHLRAGGEGMAPVSPMSQFSLGLKPFFSFMAIFIYILGMIIVFGIPMGAIGYAGENGMIPQDILPLLMAPIGLVAFFVYMAIIIGINVLMPEALRRVYAGDGLALLKPIQMVRTVLKAPKAYLYIWLGLMLANMLGSVGVIACYFGIFITMPLSWAIMAHLVAQWANHVETL